MHGAGGSVGGVERLRFTFRLCETIDWEYITPQDGDFEEEEETEGGKSF